MGCAPTTSRAPSCSGRSAAAASWAATCSPAKRPYFDTFFSFVCYIDDLADDINLSVDVRARRLDEWERTYLAIAKGDPVPADGPLSRSEETDASSPGRWCTPCGPGTCPT